MRYKGEGIICPVCGAVATELHHIIFKSQVKQLENCELNFIYLCGNCHRGTNGVHGKNGHKLDQKFKLMFQNKLEIFFSKTYLDAGEIKKVLQIKDKQLNSLVKTLILQNGKYSKEDVIRACMGGRIILEDDNNGRT